MKRIGSLFVILALILAMISAGAMTVLAEPVIDNAAGTMTYTENFNNIVVNKSAEASSEAVYFSAPSDFSIILGAEGEFKCGGDSKYNFRTANGTGDHAKCFGADRLHSINETVAIKFPAVTTGKFTISFWAHSNGAADKGNNFASLVNIDENGVLTETFVPVYIESNGVVNGSTVLSDTTYRGRWNKYKYTVDMTAKTYKIEVYHAEGGEFGVVDDIVDVVSEGTFADAANIAANALYFNNNNAKTTDSEGFRFDTVEVTVPIPAKNVTFKDADGATIETITAQGGSVTPPSVTPENGRVFLGWVTEGTTEHFNDFSKITEDMTLVAVYGNYNSIKEDFTGASKTVSDSKISINLVSNPKFDIVLGEGATFRQADSQPVGDNIAIGTANATNDVPYGVEGSYLKVDRMPKAGVDTIAIKFPEISTGTFSVSFTGKVKNITASSTSDFGTIAQVDEKGALVKTLVPVYGTKQSSEGVYTMNGAEYVHIGTYLDWVDYTYIVNMTDKVYTIKAGDAVYGPYAFKENGVANALYFDNDSKGLYYNIHIDNIALSYTIPAVTFNYNGKSEKVVSDFGKVTAPIVEVGSDEIFKGWFDESGNEYTDFENVTESISLTAKVEKKPQITFIYNNTQTTVMAENGVVANIPEPTVESGKMFLGWKDTEGKWFSDFDNVTKALTLTAIIADKIVTEDFTDITKNTDAETSKTTVGLGANSPFDIVLGGGTFTGANGVVGDAIMFTGGITGEGNCLRIDRMLSADDTVAIKFPSEMATGVYTISFDGHAGSGGGGNNFASLVQVDEAGALQKTIAPIYSSYVKTTTSTNNVYCVYTQDGSNNINLNSLGSWHSYTYILDMTSREYTIKVDDTVYGPFGFKDSDAEFANALYFSNTKGGTYGARIDNLKINYGAVEIGDSITGELDAGGTVKVLENDGVVEIAENAVLKNAFIDATAEGSRVMVGTTKISNGRIIFTETGEIDVALNDALKFTRDDKQGFMNKANITDAETHTITINAKGSYIKDGADISIDKDKDITFDLGKIYKGEAKFLVYVTGVPEGVEITFVK